MRLGDVVAVKDPDSGRWKSAEVVSVSPLRATVARGTWWAIVPANDPSVVRQVRVVGA